MVRVSGYRHGEQTATILALLRAGPRTTNDIADQMGVPRQRVTVLINSLVSKRLHPPVEQCAERRLDPATGRHLVLWRLRPIDLTDPEQKAKLEWAYRRAAANVAALRARLKLAQGELKRAEAARAGKATARALNGIPKFAGKPQ